VHATAEYAHAVNTGRQHASAHATAERPHATAELARMQHAQQTLLVGIEQGSRAAGGGGGHAGGGGRGSMPVHADAGHVGREVGFAGEVVASGGGRPAGMRGGVGGVGVGVGGAGVGPSAREVAAAPEHVRQHIAHAALSWVQTTTPALSRWP
jgi:hypothetical protein